MFNLAFFCGLALGAVSIIRTIVEQRQIRTIDVSGADIDGLNIRIDRTSAHPLLAEFTRTLTVNAKRRAMAVLEMDKDSGGGQRVDVCKTTEGRILLSDRFGNYLIHPDGSVRRIVDAYVAQVLPDGTTEPLVTPEMKPACLTKLGVFDQGGGPGYDYGFQPER
ncbi:hypothetical protein LRX75_07620 [Rhizobium sp. DKSPLA3]|uniref:Uncharacterized protein n=1 Tax=Rhizobium quercicola TaxID=2901226 RepID=A0A9X1NPM1_9HYPH|nr:hypothetical protein [Rhizobium quercicola]MCD7108907.1 hypothetical protein [Rhizobium quercicola]